MNAGRERIWAVVSYAEQWAERGGHPSVRGFQTPAMRMVLNDLRAALADEKPLRAPAPVSIDPASKDDERGLPWVCGTCGAQIARTKIQVHRQWHQKETE